MLITDINELKIQYDEPLRLLRVKWVAGRDMRRFRPALEQVQQLADRLQVTHGLVDIGDLSDISAYDQIWLGAQWMPKVVRLPLQRIIIVLTSEQIYNQHAIEMILALGRPFIKFDFQFFAQAVPALHWLTDESPRLPALLAEWDAADYLPGPPAAGLSEPLVTYHRL